MNVAICSSGDLYGGVEQFIATFAAELVALPPHQVRVVLFSRGVLSRTLSERGIETVVFEGPRYDVTVVARLARFFRDNAVEVVHTHGYKASLYCGLAARLSGARVVKTEHGSLEPAQGLDGFKMTCNLALDRFLSRYLVDRIVYVSRDIQQRDAAHHKGLRGEVIYNGIPPVSARPTPRPPGLDTSAFSLGIVGRLTEVKGHRYLLAALADIPVSGLRLHVLGDGELREELEGISRHHGLAGRVSFLGFRTDAQDYLRALDAVVMPSLNEGFPYAMLEAAYWGVPLIASRVGGMCEVLTDGHDCLFVEPRSVDQLKQAILKLYHDPALRKMLGENARRNVMDHFLIESMVGKYLSVYEKSLRMRFGALNHAYKPVPR